MPSLCQAWYRFLPQLTVPTGNSLPISGPQFSISETGGVQALTLAVLQGPFRARTPFQTTSPPSTPMTGLLTTGHYTFVKTQRMDNTRSETSVNYGCQLVMMY